MYVHTFEWYLGLQIEAALCQYLQVVYITYFVYVCVCVCADSTVNYNKQQ